MSTSQSAYQVPWVANFFHSFPHFNFTFQGISSTFDPENASYQESLIVWAAVPVLVLVLSLIFFLIFYCCRCFRRSHDRKPTRGKCFSWTIGVFIIISCAAVALGFYGNEDVSKGVTQLTTAADTLEGSFETIQDHSYDLETTLNNTVKDNVRLLEQTLNSAVINATVRPEVDKLITSVKKQLLHVIGEVSGADNNFENIDIKPYIKATKSGEYYRWMSTIIVCSWTLAICLLWFIAIGKASKGILFVCAVLGMLTLTICWCAGGVHSGVSVGVADFCVDPDRFILDYATKNNVIERDILVYYISSCNDTAAPFKKAIQDGTASLIAINKMVTNIDSLASHFVEKTKLAPIINDLTKALTTSVELLGQISELASCVNIHKEYIDAVNGVCVLGLGGIAFLLLAFVVLGMTFLVMLVLAPFAWRKMGKRRRFVQVDEDDPFLPRHGASNSGVSNNSPGYYRFSEPGGEPTPLGRRTPPPAYGEHSEGRTLANRNTFSRSSDV